MPETTIRQSPLAHLGYGGQVRDTLGDAGLGISERAYRALIDIRVDLDKEPKAQEAFAATAGVQLPTTANTATGADGLDVLWLGPNEWLLVAHDPRPEAPREWVGRLRAAMQAHHCAVVDVSHAQAVLGVTGPLAREVLEGAVPLDMHPRAFQPGEVKQTLFGRHTGVTLHLRDDAPTFDLYCRRSFAEYVWRYLEDCARGACAQVAVLAR